VSDIADLNLVNIAHPKKDRISFKDFWKIIIDTYKEWDRDDPWRHSAINYSGHHSRNFS
jgi:hypothetical protein